LGLGCVGGPRRRFGCVGAPARALETQVRRQCGRPYTELYEQAAGEADADTLGWLAAAGFGYQRLRAENAKKVRRMSLLSGALGVLMIAQTLAWLAALAIH
jgi:hypothetical protein